MDVQVAEGGRNPWKIRPLDAPTLFSGPPAYESRTPWSPLAALLAAVVIVGASILGPILVLGSSFVAGIRRTGPGAGRQDMSALATLAIWQAIAVVLTVLASVLFGGRMRDVLALRPPGAAQVYLKAVLLMAVLQVVVSAVQYFFLPQDMYADLRPFVRLFGEQWVLALLVVGRRRAAVGGAAVPRLPAVGAGALAAGLCRRRRWSRRSCGRPCTPAIRSPASWRCSLIGLFFSWLLWRTGSLRVPIFCHALYNSLIVLVLRHVPLPT